MVMNNGWGDGENKKVRQEKTKVRWERFDRNCDVWSGRGDRRFLEEMRRFQGKGVLLTMYGVMFQSLARFGGHFIWPIANFCGTHHHYLSHIWTVSPLPLLCLWNTASFIGKLLPTRNSFSTYLFLLFLVKSYFSFIDFPGYPTRVLGQTNSMLFWSST